MEKQKRLNLVLEGGGTKGIGFVGAIEEFEKKGYEWVYLAGTSAGAIVATLMAVEYSGNELTSIMNDLNFKNVMDDAKAQKDVISITRAKGFWQYLLKAPQIIRLIIRIYRDNGLFNGDYIENYIRDLIEKKKGKKNYTFGDLKNDTELSAPKLSLMVTDITGKRLLVLPNDADKLGISPDELELALAMRMSMSFPFFFKPVTINNKITSKKNWIMDGGVLSNFPYWYVDLLKTGIDEPSYENSYPTVGLLLDEKSDGPITDAWSMLMSLLNTMISPLDQAYGMYDKRVVKIPVAVTDEEGKHEVSTLEFDLSKEAKKQLWENGKKAALDFLKGFNYNKELKEQAWSSWSNRIRGGKGSEGGGGPK